jgi:hypothetical protein
MRVFSNFSNNVWINLALSGTLLLGFCAGAKAQVKKKQTRKTQSVTRQNLPIDISQAEQYQNQSRQIIIGNTENDLSVVNQNQTETFDEKLDKINRGLEELNRRLNTVESNQKKDYEEKQKRLLTNLDILTKAEQRAESLRKQLFELVEKENSIKTRLEQLQYDLRPEAIDRQVAFAGTLRPEELREMRKKNLEVEKRNLENLLTEIQTSRVNLEQNVQKADQLVERLRAKLEKDIDETLSEDSDLL